LHVGVKDVCKFDFSGNSKPFKGIYCCALMHGGKVAKLSVRWERLFLRWGRLFRGVARGVMVAFVLIIMELL